MYFTSHHKARRSSAIHPLSCLSCSHVRARPKRSARLPRGGWRPVTHHGRMPAQRVQRVPSLEPPFPATYVRARDPPRTGREAGRLQAPSRRALTADGEQRFQTVTHLPPASAPPLTTSVSPPLPSSTLQHPHRTASHHGLLRLSPARGGHHLLLLLRQTSDSVLIMTFLPRNAPIWTLRIHQSILEEGVEWD